MPFQLDHLIAAIVGAIVLLALVTLQQRDQSASVETTLTQAVRARTSVAIDALARDTENLLTPEQATEFGVPYDVRVTSDGERTTQASFTSFAGTGSATPGIPPPGQVCYALQPTGRTVTVGAETVDTHRLTRQTGACGGGGDVHMVADEVVDLDIVFLSPFDEVDNGIPPSGVTQVRVEIAVATPGLAQRSGEQTSIRETNLVRMGVTLRPINLPPQV